MIITNKMKFSIVTVLLAVFGFTAMLASTPQPVDPMKTDTTQSATEYIGHDPDNHFILDFDLKSITETHKEYFVPLTGVDIAFVGIVVVFLSLIIIAILFTALSNFMVYLQKRRLSRSKGSAVQDITDDAVEYSGEINAAIAMALHMYFNEARDEESGVLTINKIQRRYSPWSSKIYNINQNPFK